MFTGEKDSSYILWIKKNVYKLDVIALTIDNDFLDKKCLNIQSQYVKKLV